MLLQEAQQGIARNEVRLSRLDHFCGYFVGVIGNRGIQAQYVSGLGDLRDKSLSFARRSGKFCLPAAKYKYAAGRLTLHKQDRGLWIDRRRLDLVQPLQSWRRQI